MSVQSVHDHSSHRSVRNAILTGVKCRCPSCGEGRLFDKWLKVTPVCNACGEELFHERAQDFPPYITISIVGHIVVTLLLIVEANIELLHDHPSSDLGAACSGADIGADAACQRRCRRHAMGPAHVWF